MLGYIRLGRVDNELPYAIFIYCDGELLATDDILAAVLININHYNMSCCFVI